VEHVCARQSANALAWLETGRFERESLLADGAILGAHAFGEIMHEHQLGELVAL